MIIELCIGWPAAPGRPGGTTTNLRCAHSRFDPRTTRAVSRRALCTIPSAQIDHGIRAVF